MGVRFKPGGVNFRCDGYTVVESHTKSCTHCQQNVEFESIKRMFDKLDVCRTCMGLICLNCYGKPCVTWLQKCEIDEAYHRKKLWGNLQEF